MLRVPPRLPSDAERERLLKLIEECAEVQQAATKVLRHGYESWCPPASPGAAVGETNRQALERELGDLRHATSLLFSGGDVDEGRVVDAFTDKLVRGGQWLHFQGSR